MIQSIQAKDVQAGMSLILGLVPYKVTYKETKEDGRIQFHLYRLSIRTSLVVKSNDDITVET